MLMLDIYERHLSPKHAYSFPTSRLFALYVFTYRQLQSLDVSFAFAFHWFSRTGMSAVWCPLHLERVKLASSSQVRGVGVGCVAPHDQILRIIRMDFAPPGHSMNLHIWPFQGGLVLCYSLSLISALWFIAVVPFSPGRRYRLPERTAPPPLRSEGIGRTASNQYLVQNIQHPSNPRAWVWVIGTEPEKPLHT